MKNKGIVGCKNERNWNLQLIWFVIFQFSQFLQRSVKFYNQNSKQESHLPSVWLHLWNNCKAVLEKIWCTSTYIFSLGGGPYSDARMLNWPHRHRTPLSWIASLGLHRNTGNALRQETFLHPFFRCLLAHVDSATTQSLTLEFTDC